MPGESHKTQKHATIQKWADERGGIPSNVIGTGKGEAGILRIDFPGYSGEDSLEEITWEDFFEKFDAAGLTFLYQNDTADGEESRFCKFISE